MRSHTHVQRRGAALLLVLATLVLLASAAAALGRVASTVSARRSFDIATAAADDLARQAERVVLAWLESESSQVVLPASATTPEVAVLHNTWEQDGVLCDVQVTAWDQLGLVPHGAARSGSPLRTAIPEGLRRILDRSAAALPLGLDQFEGATSRRSPYPRARHSRADLFGRGDRAIELVPRVIHPAIGAYVATHNARPERINVNTAPLAVVEAAMRMLGLGGIEAIEEARAKGFLTTAGAALAGDATENGTAPVLVSRSESWAFRIDVTSGPVSRSWWTVFEYVDTWTLVQRLAIPG